MIISFKILFSENTREKIIVPLKTEKNYKINLFINKYKKFSFIIIKQNLLIK